MPGGRRGRHAGLVPECGPLFPASWLPADLHLHERFIPLFRDSYPDIRLIPSDQAGPERFYATYKLMVYFADHDRAARAAASS